MAEPPQKKKKQSQGNMYNITSEALIQVAKIKRWLGKECSTEMHPLKSCLFKLTKIFFILYINNTYYVFLDYGTLTILLKCMAQRFVRLLFDVTCRFVFMISVYSDVNSSCMSRIFLFVDRWKDSSTWGILVGNGET